MLGGYSLELRFCGVVLVVGIVNFHWTSSFGAINPQHIVSSQGIYHFAAQKKGLRLVLDMLNSNRNWKGKYFFVQGTD